LCGGEKSGASPRSRFLHLRGKSGNGVRPLARTDRSVLRKMRPDPISKSSGGPIDLRMGVWSVSRWELAMMADLLKAK
jgi:hypothetical protein